MSCGILPEICFQPADAEKTQGLACHSCPPGAKALVERAAACLRAGGIVVYPAATFYALGCLAQNVEAAELVCETKGRDEGHPLPLLAASMEQAASCVNLEGEAARLAELFWPGPLSILLPAKNNLAPRAVNGRGLAAIRIDANPLARSLALHAGGVLTASSANISGRPPSATLTGLDQDLLSRLEKLGDRAFVLGACGPWCEPTGGLPSTIVEVFAKTHDNGLRVLRRGAVSDAALSRAGYLPEVT